MVYTVRSYGKEAPWLLSVMGAMFSIGKIMSPFIVGPFITHLNEETEEVLIFLILIYFNKIKY